MERLYLTVFGVLAAAAIGAVLGERLESAREADGELMSIFGTVLLWAVAGIVILPNAQAPVPDGAVYGQLMICH